LDNFSSDPNNSAKTTGLTRMGLTLMMYEKLDTILEVIISEKKARQVLTEERKVQRLEIRGKKEKK